MRGNTTSCRGNLCLDREKIPRRLELLFYNNDYPILNASPRCLRLSYQSKITRDTNTAVNKFANRPKLRVTAKPRTGPVPKINKMIAETMVVTCVSTIVIQAWPKPCSTAEGGVFPLRN